LGWNDFLGGNDVFAQESYGLLGAQFSASGETWQVSAYIDNLTDEIYYDTGIDDTGINRFGIGRGVNGGVKFKYSF